MSAASRALFLQDILELILEELSPGPHISRSAHSQVLLELLAIERRRRRIALASLARVCRAISDPALSVLWRYIDDVFHLLKVNPTYYTTCRHRTYQYGVSHTLLHDSQQMN